MTTDTLLKDLQELQARALTALEESASSEALERWRVAFLGRRGELTQALRGLASIAPEERRVVGAAANGVKAVLEERLAWSGGVGQGCAACGACGAGADRRHAAGQAAVSGSPSPHHADSA